MTYDDLVPEHGDTAIILKESGRRGVAFIRHGQEIHSMPLDVTVSYGDREGDPPLTPRHITVRAGWKAKEFR